MMGGGNFGGRNQEEPSARAIRIWSRIRNAIRAFLTNSLRFFPLYIHSLALMWISRGSLPSYFIHSLPCCQVTGCVIPHSAEFTCPTVEGTSDTRHSSKVTAAGNQCQCRVTAWPFVVHGWLRGEDGDIRLLHVASWAPPGAPSQRTISQTRRRMAHIDRHGSACLQTESLES